MFYLLMVWQLFIANDLVLALGGTREAHPPPGFSGVELSQLERMYDQPSRLVMRFLGSWRREPYPADTDVRLLRDGLTVFRGLLDLPRPIASIEEYPAIEYAAYDHDRLLDHPRASAPPPTWPGQPTPERLVVFQLKAGTLATAVSELYGYIGADLATAGVATTAAFRNGADQIQTYPVRLANESISSAIRKVAASAPGVSVFLNPENPTGRPQYTFVRQFGSQTFDVTLDDAALRHPLFDVKKTIEGRAGAVKTLGGATQGSAAVNLTQTAALSPAWDAALEASWSRKEAWTTKADGTPTPKSEVFRKWSFPPGVPEGAVLRGLVKVYDNGGDDIFYAPSTVVSVDWDARTLLLNNPAIKPIFGKKAGRFNPDEPGRCKATDSAFVQYAESQVGNVPIFMRSYRFPPAGFSGNAFQLAPKTCGYEAVIAVPEGVDAAQYAQDAWNALSEPLVDGTVPILGECPEELLYLDRRINIRTATHGPTLYEAMAAPLLGITLNFTGFPRTILHFSRDTSRLLKEGL